MKSEDERKAGPLRLTSYRGGEYWGIIKHFSVAVDGRKYYKQEFLINLRGSIPEEEAKALLRDLEEGRAEVCKDRFGHKYVHYQGGRS